MESTNEEIYSELNGLVGQDGVEWQIDAPWRIAPESNGTYNGIPLTISFHDMNLQDQLPIERFCGMYVMEPGSSFLSSGPVTLIRPEEFHEIETSKRWRKEGDLPPPLNTAHLLARVWDGDRLTNGNAELDPLKMSNRAEWHGTAFFTPQTASPGADIKLIAFAWISKSSTCVEPQTQPTSNELLWQIKDGRVSNFPRTESAGSLLFADFLKVHYALAPFPKFSDDWVYGDLHYHSQGTDNEGESAINYRGVIQAVKAMGLDYVFATDHASNARQITSGHQLFITDIPDLGWFAEAMLTLFGIDVEAKLEELAQSFVGLPLINSEALRDMGPARFTYLHEWINASNGVNAEVGASPGSRTPQLFLGAEVDIIGEMSTQDEANGYYTYAGRRKFEWSRLCSDLPSFIINFTNFTTTCREAVTDDGSAVGRRSIKDPQGLGIMDSTRQHLIHLPPSHLEYLDEPDRRIRRNDFISSDNGWYGGGNRWMPDIIFELETGKGDAFLAHPTAAPSGNGVNRLAPDIVPYSEEMLMEAFSSANILGLQLWNENKRHTTFGFPEKRNQHPMTFPMQYHDGSTHPELPEELRLTLNWNWAFENDSSLRRQLGDTGRMWDQVLLWGINPIKTAAIGLPQGTFRKFFGVAGSDAHGDLNYRREGRMLGYSGANDTAIGTPRNLSYVGSQRPGIGGGVSQNQVIDSLKSGRFSVTDGPALRIAIDTNGNGVIDDTDVPMGGEFAYSGKTVSVLVEWQSTPEFGPVENIDFYVGAQSGSSEGAIYAPAGHGANGDVACIDSTSPVVDEHGYHYCNMEDTYIQDPSGTLHINVPSLPGYGTQTLNGFRGTTSLRLRASNFRSVDIECTEFAAVLDKNGNELAPASVRCDASNGAPAKRLFTRAFAETVPDGQTRRFTFTNPIWLTTNIPEDPAVRLDHVDCSSGTNTYRVGASKRGAADGSLGIQYKIEDGSWTKIYSTTFTAGEGEHVIVRARTCSASGCSDFTSTEMDGPVCSQRPPAPFVNLAYRGCSWGANTFSAYVFQNGNVPVDSYVKRYRIGSGNWRTLNGSTIVATGSQYVYLRAQACNVAGCSGFAQTSAWGPFCSGGVLIGK